MSEPREIILLTGGAGFIGSTLVRQWLEHETAAIVDLDLLTYAGLRESLGDLVDHPRHRLVVGDVADAALVRQVFAEHRPRAVLHLAAETHVDRSIDAPPAFAHTNMLGTCTLLDEATRYWQSLSGGERDKFRFLLMSTDEVFGAAAPGEAFTRNSPLAPNSPYAASKAAAEHLAKAFGHTYGLPLVIVNPTNNYGPRQMPEKLIPRVILAAVRREPVPLYGDGLHERDWLHVDDCCRAIRRVLADGKSDQRYLIGADNVLPNRVVVERLCDLVDEHLDDGGERRGLITPVADRPGHDRRYAVDSEALRRELGWRSQVDFDFGLREVVVWYLDNPRWVAAAEASLRGRPGPKGCA